MHPTQSCLSEVSAMMSLRPRSAMRQCSHARQWNIAYRYCEVTDTCTATYLELRRIHSFVSVWLLMLQNHSFPLLYFPDWTIAMLCSQVYLNTFWTDWREFRMPLLDSQPELPIHITPILHSSAGCQCLQDYHTKYSPSITVLCQVLVLNTCPKSWNFIHHLDNSVRPLTASIFVYILSKQKPLVKDPFLTLALSSGTHFQMTPEIHNQKPHSKTFKSDLFAVHYWITECSIPFTTHVAAWVQCAFFNAPFLYLSRHYYYHLLYYCCVTSRALLLCSCSG